MGDLMSAAALDEILDYLASHFFGKYRGTVVGNADDTNRGRLQVQVPAVLGGETVWALPCVPYAGDGVGFYALPEPGTAIWVEFEGGDPSFAVWTGCFWADNELPDMGGAAIKILQTAKATLRIDDGPGDVVVSNDRDSAVTLAGDATIAAAAGENTARHVVGGTGVKSDSGGGATVDVNGPAVSVNDGALKVA
jgi:uncharacterized protein involved in type VI secretion and phage assembly